MGFYTNMGAKGEVSSWVLYAILSYGLGLHREGRWKSKYLVNACLLGHTKKMEHRVDSEL